MSTEGDVHLISREEKDSRLVSQGDLKTVTLKLVVDYSRRPNWDFLFKWGFTLFEQEGFVYATILAYKYTNTLHWEVVHNGFAIKETIREE